MSTITGELARGLDAWDGPPGHPRPPRATLGELNSSYGSSRNAHASSSRGRTPSAGPVRPASSKQGTHDDEDDDVVPDSDDENQAGQYCVPVMVIRPVGWME